MRTPIYAFLLIVALFLIGCSAFTNFSSEEDGNEPEDTPEEAAKLEEEESEEALEEETEREAIEEEEVEFENQDELDHEAEENNDQGDYNVYIGGEVIETDDKIIIHGKSNLIPGSRVVGEVSVGKNIRHLIVPSIKDFDFLADTSEIVDEDGNFYMELEHPNLNEETAVSVKFHFDGQQNDDVIRHYGDRGQNLEGPYIYKHQGERGGRGPDNIYNKAEVKTVFVPEKEKAVRQFSKPDWYEDVDNIGDPRVWIEVEELNDDGEYYYVHGRSNLIEGSRVIIRRNFSQKDEKLVN